MKKIDVDEVIKKNPRVTRQDFAAADEVSRQMQEEGARRHGYRVAGPGNGRPVEFGKTGKEDRRTFHTKK